jgi:uncharacterized protein YjbI with pentapeptide repeats
MTTYGLDDRLKENHKALTDPWKNLTLQQLGIVFGMVAFFVVVLGYLNQYMNLWSNVGWLTNIFGDFYANVSSELISIVITVLVLERLNARRASQERKLALFRQAKSRSNDAALEALDQILHDNLWDAFREYYRDENGTVNLNGVRWEGTELEHVNLKDTSLKYANLEGTNLSNSNLEGANLYRANLKGTNLPNSRLKGADLSYANLKDVNLEYANLESANLADANLKGADLSNAHLENAKLRQANLQGANLSNTVQISAKRWEAHREAAGDFGAYVPEAHIVRAHLKGADLSYANLKDVNLEYANLEGANLGNANLKGADLSNANLKDTSLKYANLEGTNLSNSNLEGANLWRVSLRGAKGLEKVNFNGKTVLPDAVNIGRDDKGNVILDKYWTVITDMARYTNPEHSDFWASKWVK